MSAVLGVAAVPATAEAHSLESRHHHHYEVLYRVGHHHWVAYGVYGSRHEANRAAEFLRCRGYFVEIRAC
jgi:hypothetical protein